VLEEIVVDPKLKYVTTTVGLGLKFLIPNPYGIYEASSSGCKWQNKMANTTFSLANNESVLKGVYIEGV